MNRAQSFRKCKILAFNSTLLVLLIFLQINSISADVNLPIGGEDNDHLSAGESLVYTSTLSSNHYILEVDASHDLDIKIRFSKNGEFIEEVDNIGPSETDFYYFEIIGSNILCTFEIVAKSGSGFTSTRLMIDTSSGIAGSSPTGQQSTAIVISSSGLSAGYIASGEEMTYHASLTQGNYKISAGGSHDLDIRLTLYYTDGSSDTVNDGAYSDDEKINFEVIDEGIHYFHIEAIGGGGFLTVTLTETVLTPDLILPLLFGIIVLIGVSIAFKKFQGRTYRKTSYQKPSYQKQSFQKQSFQKPSYQKTSYQKPSYQKPSFQKSTYKKPAERSISPPSRSITQQNIDKLLGMVQAEERFSLSEAKRYIDLSEIEIKGIIYELVGKKKISGHFKGNEFIIDSNIDNFIENLDDAFKDWNKKERDNIAKS